MILEPRKILGTGVPVLTADGRRGRLHEVLLSPGHWRLNALVVRHGILLPRDVVVPVEQVASITEAQVRLRLSRAELAQLSTYQRATDMRLAPIGARRALVAVQYGRGGTSERIIEVPSSTALAIAGGQGGPTDGLIALRAGQNVWSGTQGVGRLERLLLDSSGQVRHIVVRTSRMFGRQVIVPIEAVARIDAQGVWLALDRVALHRLPDYRTDRAILIDVDQALWADEIVRRLDYRSIDVMVGAGVVVLRGYATTPVSRVRAERAARGVRGVLGVVNEIVADGEIQLAVAQALGHDERTRRHRLLVHVQRGVVYVSGEVESPGVRTAVEAVAGSVPRVRAVINQVSVPGDAGATEDLRALFPRIGQDVYTSETRLGQVERVIIHPRHRRVTALVVRGWMAESQQGTAGVSLEPPARQERRLIIPTSAVREATEAAVLLHIGYEAAMGHADLDPAAYAPPAADWQPPYPYTHANVLLEPSRTHTAPGHALGVSSKPEDILERYDS
jgi:osmotically-inducible protein OsmY/uncharacterized protein YrrD